VLFALAATLAVWVIASVAGVDLAVKSGPHDVRTVGLASVVLATLAAGVGACALLAATQRFARRPGTTFAASAFALLLVSLAGPIGLGHTTGAQAMLTSMHLAAAGVLIPTLARSAGWVDSIPRGAGRQPTRWQVGLNAELKKRKTAA
jgi:hypothetical protein